MFKELGEFIDNVGRATGYAVKRLLSDDESLQMTGYEDTDELLGGELPEELRKELDEQDVVNVIDNDNIDDV